MVDNYQPSIVLDQSLALEGVFPNPNTDYGAFSFLGAIRTLAWTGSELPSCLGQNISIPQNAALFSLLGTSFGGNGQTTFGVPNLAGRLSAGLNSDFGAQSGLPTVPIFAPNLPFNYGGTGAAIGNEQPSLVTSFLIRTAPDPDPATWPGGAFVGSIMQFASYFAPAGFKFCNGAVLNIVDYPALFAAIGDTYGGDGVTTFALPDLRSRAIVGASADHPLGDMFGSEEISITQANLPVNMGGSGTPIDNHSPSLAMTYLISVAGYDTDITWPDEGPILGEIVAYAGSAPPTGYMVADGSLLDTTLYAALFNRIGYTFGGSGSEFALPDLRGRAIVSEGAGPGIGTFNFGDTLGTAEIVLTSADFPALTIAGTGADETLWGADQGDTISGSDGADTLYGNKGNDSLSGGNGNDVLRGGDGSDTFNGGAGIDKIMSFFAAADTFVYAAALDSTGAAFDILRACDFSGDTFVLPSAVTGIDVTIATGTLRGSLFNTDLAAAADAAHLGANHAVIFTPDAGNKAGKIFLVVDLNGVAGYQNGADLVVRLISPTNLASLGTEDFT